MYKIPLYFIADKGTR